MKDTYTLGIETSCDESSIAIVKNGVIPIAEATASQVKLMAKYGGVVPELSARKHLEALPILLEEIKKKAPREYKQISAIAVTVEPGLPPALATGKAFAHGLALARKLPLVEVNHLHAHLVSSLIEDDTPENTPKNYSKDVEFPHVSLLVSGGHTSLFYVKSPTEYELLGQTKDDAAGEAFDKVARMLGLGYPGGPIIQKWAERAAEIPTKSWQIPKDVFTLPIPNERNQFSFSGLKTAVRRLIVSLTEGEGTKTPKGINIEQLGKSLPDKIKVQIAYRFQDIVAESLTLKTIEAAEDKEVTMITVSGGVAANTELRKRMSEKALDAGLKLKYPHLKRCTDNATMVACAGYFLT